MNEIAMKRMDAGRRILTVLLLLASGAVLAHEDAAGNATGFGSGFLHPLLGWDHIIAMVAVGLWGAFLGMPALWILPVAFPLVMAIGGAAGVIGLSLPGVEIGIAASGVMLGLMVAFGTRPPIWAATLVVGTFAVFHGHAHGTELPFAASPLAYSVGFVLSTGLLHLGGIAFGSLIRWPAGRVAVRLTGVAIAVAGLGFLGGVA